MSESNTRKLPKEDFLPTTYLAVLSLVGGGAKYGYEINRILEERGYRNWVDMGFSSVYKALSELEKKGLVKGIKDDRTLKPSKKIFNLTRKGKKTLRDHIYRCLSDPPRVNSLFDLGMSAIFFLTKDEALDALRAYLIKLDNSLQFFESNLETIENIEKYAGAKSDRMIGSQKVADMHPPFRMGPVHALFKRPYIRVKCERKWLHDLIQKIERDEGGFQFRSTKKAKR